MGPITFDLKLFISNNQQEIRRSRKSLLWLMEALVQHNLNWIRTYAAPALYNSGVIYVREKGTEIWQDIPTILEHGKGDCEDLASWRVAELQAAGIAARPYIKWRKTGDHYTYHALVWLPGDRIEDPSIALGMHGKVIGKPVYVEE